MIEKVTREISEDYYLKKKHNNPVWFNEMETFLKRKQIKFEKIINRIMKIVNKNIAHRFLNHRSKKIKLYKLDLKNKALRFKTTDVEIIKNYSNILIDLINAKWALYLESFNNSPYLLRKVIDSAGNSLKKQNLRTIKNLLVEHYHNEGIKDFYTGEHLEYRDAKMVHVIPYNYIYCNNIWNLVITNKNSKIRITPLDEDMKKLKIRNENLLKMLKNVSNKEKQDLENVVDNNLLDKCFMDMKG